jgi:transposase
MRRYELADDQWWRIADLFPSNEGKRGGQWLDHRLIMNGMLTQI